MAMPHTPLRTIALVAHDAKKSDMVEFCQRHREALSAFALIGTGTTSARIVDATGLDIERLLSGPLGGDQQIGARVATGQVHALFFFTDPLTAHPHEPDVLGLLRLCNVHGVPVAPNVATAELLIDGLNRQRLSNKAASV